MSVPPIGNEAALINLNKLNVLDEDFRRRAKIYQDSSQHFAHVEIFESLEELKAAWPSDGVILAHDSKGKLGDVIQAMSSTRKCLPLLAYSENPACRNVVDAVTSGCCDYFEFPFEMGQVVERINTQNRNIRIVFAKFLLKCEAKKLISTLSERQKEVLFSSSRGKTSKEVGEELGISARTVEVHRSDILRKFKMKNFRNAMRTVYDAELMLEEE